MSNSNINGCVMTHGSLFSGIGGFELAAERVGWSNEFHCEINPFGQKILKHYWPKAISYEDITKTDFSIWRGRIDVLTGGFPCQPFSQAGNRKGKDDDRYLWPEMLRAIDEIRPRWICGENVAGITTMVQPEIVKTKVEGQASFFGENDQEIVTEWQQHVTETICADLERLGYSIQPVIVPACAVGAPHRRDRIWFIANSERNHDFRTFIGSDGETEGMEGVDREEDGAARQFSRADFRHDEGSNNVEYATADTCCTRFSFPKGHRGNENTEDVGANGLGEHWNVADAGNQRLQRREDVGSIGSIGAKSNKQSTGRFCADWKNFPTQSPICGGDDGIPTGLDGITFPKWRNESIKGYGNAIVPKVAYEIFKAIEEYESDNK